ncbi:dTDP-glucose 4,6-dehydratase, partial [Synechococcus sp. GFB01]|uniref:dTDP-glucose 4,6-dehydratase n=1 Tax=Synechococcus sp. GFB01 TaxID=1662190 RepID=UPI0021012072
MPAPTRHLLITGGAGFIAGNLVHHWAAARPHDRIVVLDALTYAGNRATIAPLIDAGRISFVHGDIGDRPLVDALLAEHAITHVAHLAAESHVDRSISGPAAFLATNVHGTFTLLEAFRAHWLAAGSPEHWRFLHVSTDEVFGSLEPSDPPFCETTPYSPRSPYAASKAASDHLARAWQHTYGLPVLVSNCSRLAAALVALAGALQPVLPASALEEVVIQLPLLETSFTVRVSELANPDA